MDNESSLAQNFLCHATAIVQTVVGLAWPCLRGVSDANAMAQRRPRARPPAPAAKDTAQMIFRPFARQGGSEAVCHCYVIRAGASQPLWMANAAFPSSWKSPSVGVCTCVLPFQRFQHRSVSRALSIHAHGLPRLSQYLWIL